ncbi:HAMP domain-containing protein [Taibaiella lutea]|uniref:histidine kinase n=1 Tax=Taibaiella lutea TaxID=2608001 RepID=A0A5M6CH93_9BACT|nr:ATP-binding protein [Taibaiella lutea]KAA5533790.1 HAMP domain-containing protein [Taibaiella lutea]
MKIKTKLTLGVGLLFVLIILLSGVAAIYINALKSDTNNILIDNYNSLEFSRNMMIALEENGTDANEKFNISLKQQEANITEPGEDEITKNIRTNFELLKQHPVDSLVRKNIRQNISILMGMNMEAIQGKSQQAKKTATNASIYIAITGTCCFLIAFVLLFNLPSNIADPIRNLTSAIEEIANKNYSKRIYLEHHNEYGALAASFNTMAQKLEEYNNSNLAKLMMEKKRIETLINNMHDPVIGLDESLKVIFANEEAFKLSGIPAKDMIGHQAQNLAIHNDLIRELVQTLTTPETNLKENKQPPIKIFSDNKEGYFERETVRISIVPTGEQLPQVIGHVIILKNITAYKELDFAKTNFIATVSHEFKTPIASIKMSLQLLENEQIGKLNAEQQNLVGSIKDDSNRLLKITAELLNMTQVESGNIQLSLMPANAKEILQFAIDANKVQAEQKQIQLKTEVSDLLPDVFADNEKTAWVLTNLISNAIRYSYDNSEITLSIVCKDDKIQFAVKDSGQGIAPQYLNKIFDRYFKVPGTKKEGTGLGLAISKEFVEAQSGNISVDSEYGSGSTFVVSLNVAK